MLAGIGKVECDHGRNPDPACWQEGAENAAGAGGPMQFLAATWQEYGIAASGSGTPDRWNPADAIVSAANFLKANGAPDNIEQAVFAYNHSDSLRAAGARLGGPVRERLRRRRERVSAGHRGGRVARPGRAGRGQPTRLPSSAPPTAGAATSRAASTAPASCRPPTQPRGIALPRVAQAQYDAGPPVPAGQPLQPGDLVFFGADPADVTHVGIVVSPGEMVDAPHTGAVVRIEPYSWPDFLGATRPAGAQP